MSRTVWKFPLLLAFGQQVVSLPPFSFIRHAGMQVNDLCLWVECDVHDDRIEHTIAVYPTGARHTEHEHRFIATVFYDDLVLHVYEVVSP